jgi:hypothetical protein
MAIDTGVDRCGQIAALGTDAWQENRHIGARCAYVDQGSGLGGADDESDVAIAVPLLLGKLGDRHIEWSTIGEDQFLEVRAARI